MFVFHLVHSSSDLSLTEPDKSEVLKKEEIFAAGCSQKLDGLKKIIEMRRSYSQIQLTKLVFSTFTSVNHAPLRIRAATECGVCLYEVGRRRVVTEEEIF